jgi:hypothetical protein
MSEYFQEVVTEVVQARSLDASESAVSYLVGVLCDFAHPDPTVESTLSQPLTFLLRDALETTGRERFRRLRALGDGVLYGAGFFGGHIETRGADRSYVLTVGSTAYGAASAMMRRNPQVGGPDVLGELAEKFDRFVGVLADVADGVLARGAGDERTIVKLYERWLRTGSTRLAEELGTLGIVPSRAPSGLN